jgi:hypothetical protein
VRLQGLTCDVTLHASCLPTYVTHIFRLHFIITKFVVDGENYEGLHYGAKLYKANINKMRQILNEFENWYCHAKLRDKGFGSC